MEITISGKHLEITDAIRDYAADKTAKLPRYFDRITEIEILADKSDSWQYEIEMIVHVERSDPFVVRTHGDDLYACIDGAVDRLERQLHEHKEKLRNRKHLKR